MRKLLFAAVAALTLGFASCSETPKADEATTVIENLKAELESGDASALQATLTDVKTKIAELVAENPEAAKTYISKVQEFLKENQEKIIAAVGDNAVAEDIVTSLTEAPADVLINALTAGQSVIDNAEQLPETIEEAAIDKAAELQESAENAVNEQVDAAKQTATDKVNEATQKANDEVNKAAEKANKEVNEAASKALKSVGL